MNELNFIDNLMQFRMKIYTGSKLRETIIPTTAMILLYGDRKKTKIISQEHHEHFYSVIKKIDSFLPTNRLEQLKESGMDENAIILLIQEEYDEYLKEMKKYIVKIQKAWSKSFSHQRARFLMKKLNYSNVYHICDIVVQRNVPYELILKFVFNVESYYGEFRKETPKKDIYVDPRILKILQKEKVNIGLSVKGDKLEQEHLVLSNNEIVNE